MLIYFNTSMLSRQWYDSIIQNRI